MRTSEKRHAHERLSGRGASGRNRVYICVCVCVCVCMRAIESGSKASFASKNTRVILI